MWKSPNQGEVNPPAMNGVEDAATRHARFAIVLARRDSGVGAMKEGKGPLIADSGAHHPIGDRTVHFSEIPVRGTSRKVQLKRSYTTGAPLRVAPVVSVKSLSIPRCRAILLTPAGPVSRPLASLGRVGHG